MMSQLSAVILKDNKGDTRNRLDHACLQKIGKNALGLTILDHSVDLFILCIN